MKPRSPSDRATARGYARIERATFRTNALGPDATALERTSTNLSAIRPRRVVVTTLDATLAQRSTIARIPRCSSRLESSNVGVIPRTDRPLSLKPLGTRAPHRAAIASARIGPLAKLGQTLLELPDALLESAMHVRARLRRRVPSIAVAVDAVTPHPLALTAHPFASLACTAHPLANRVGVDSVPPHRPAPSLVGLR